MQPTGVRLIESSSAQLRLAEARAFVETHLASGDVWIIAASRGAADDFARTIALAAGATMGLHRFSLTQLALRLAAPVLVALDRAPATFLGSEAVAARATFDALHDDALTYFGPVARTPGFPRALARTVYELRLARVEPERLAALPLGGRDLEALLHGFEAQFDGARAIDRAALVAAATAAVAAHQGLSGLTPAPILLLDLPIDSQVELAFVRALLEAVAGSQLPADNFPRPASESPIPGAGSPIPGPRSPVPDPRSLIPGPRSLLTVPYGDLSTLTRLKTLGLEPAILEQKDDSDLAALRRNLFADRQPPERDPLGDVVFYSAPGEGRECVEVARRVLSEAARGVRFDEIAVFVRAPERYAGLLEHAFRRAGVPAWFDRGIRRPDPAGRALLAILACAVEKLSARRFAEYLSLGQVPSRAQAERPPAFVAPLADEDVETDPAPLPFDGPPEPADDDDPLLDGSLRAPWKWEHFIVESAVIGGDPARWHRRLAGFRNELRLQLDAERREDPDSPAAARIGRDLRNIDHLRAFALPIVERLASWPASATWGEWLERFVAIAPLVLSRPDRVQAVLEQLRPMSAIGPVSLEEARDVIADRLSMLELDPPRARYGCVFVGGPQQARGRTFRVAFVVGLAERMFPQHPHEDPLMLDGEMRAPLGADLLDQDGRLSTERLLLRLAVGAPTERLWLSYPRLDTAESRPRVPSFYALDIMRAVTGRIPAHHALQERAAAEGRALLAWPAPADAADAIDDLEHDLAVLKSLIEVEPPASVRGQAHYLLRLNECLKRSVTARWARGRAQWTPFDGLTRVTGMTKPILDAKRLGARPYSLSALQKYATCPYQFLLSAIHRLTPPKDVDPLQKLDPLTRGSIFHEVQTRVLRALRDEGALPLRPSNLSQALQTLDVMIDAVSSKYRDRLAPAIDRVWRNEIDDLARDLRVWVRRIASADDPDWLPLYFEFAFGLREERHGDAPPRDAASLPDPVMIDGRFTLRGSIDLVESRIGPRTTDHGLRTTDHGSRTTDHGPRTTLRITDHKTGKNRTTWKTVIGGGAILQPVLYGLAVEQALAASVTSCRLFYCTSACGFVDHEIPLNDQNRRAGLEALEIVDRAIELGFLPAAPAERACTWCDFRAVCGPDERSRVSRKVQDKLGDLEALREKA
jgi:ATP-dependent helicase/nuclease subunit B